MMVFDPGLEEGCILSNEELSSIFKCSTQGGMRRSIKTNTLVLISNYSDPSVPYHDRWNESIFYYTGMGISGDQSLEWSQNKTLDKSNDMDGLGVFLFEVFEKNRYTFQGQVQLAGDRYQEIQKDNNGDERKVWIFPLKLVNIDSPVPISEGIIEDLSKKRERYTKKISFEDLQNKANDASGIPGERQVISKHFERNQYVVEYAKRRANGTCQLCQSSAPFKNLQGEPYLEVHHVIPLAQGGMDSMSNTVALCPNCHRKMHVLNDDEDRLFLLNLVGSDAYSSKN